MNKPELLAPAGSAECLKAALLAGADAIYLAGKRFGARAFASNFDEEGLRWARKVTKALGKKLYITFNTIVFEHEWNLLTKALDFMELLQPDALIIQDIGIAVELRKRGSKIPLHLSTQGAWYGQGGVEELKELGITRVILPRETTKDEITEIVNNNPFEVEVFVHGAMCYSISGRCFWSATLGTRSGNRGTCAQPCRRDYSIADSNYSGCLFSPRDLRLIDDIVPLMRTGVDSLKIEGRMKSPEYVYQVVKAYRAAIDGQKIENENSLDEVFSRVCSSGFFWKCPKASEWKTGDNPGREGVVVGIATGKTSEGLTEVICKNDIKPGDGLFWYEGNEQKGARITWVQTDKAKKNRIWLRGLPRNLKQNTELRRTSQSSEQNWENKWNKSMERTPIDLFWAGDAKTTLSLSTFYNGHKICLSTEELLENASSKGVEEGPIQEKFEVIGEDFVVTNNNFEKLGKKLFINGSSLKKLKRLLAEELSRVSKLSPSENAEYNEKDENNTFVIDKSIVYRTKEQRPQIRVRLWNELSLINKNIKADSWVIPWSERKKVNINNLPSDKISYWLPPILNSKEFDEIYKDLKQLEEGHFICFGWEAFKLSKLLPKLSFELDWCFNVANLTSLAYIKSIGIDAIISKEWKDEDIPNNLNIFRTSTAWNPLVSYTRFKGAVKTNQIVSNSHNDRFFTISLSNDATAMFLEKKASVVTTKIDSSIQIDVAVSPKENPIQVAEQLNRIIVNLKKSIYKN